MKIVVVDDDKEIADLITMYLKNENFDVVTFYESTKAIEYLAVNVPNLLLLDIMMPDVSGFDILKKVRENTYYPIVFISAKDKEMDILNGLAIGGDNYITKPFKPLELVARIKAILRMQSAYESIHPRNNIFKYKELELDYENRICRLSEKEINLTGSEYEILKILAENKGKTVKSETIFQKLTGQEYYGRACNSVATHIRNIRIKLKDSFEKPEYIQTEWGKGYAIKDDY